MTDEQLTIDSLIPIEKGITLPPQEQGYVSVTLLGTRERSVTGFDWSRAQEHKIYYNMYKQHPWVRAAIDKIAHYAVQGGFTYNSAYPDKDLNKSNADYIRRFMRNSNGTKLVRATFKDLLIFGEAFWLVENNKLGEPYRALRLIPTWMSPKTTRGPDVTSWEYGVPGEKKRTYKYKDEQILHFTIDDPVGMSSGLSPLASLVSTVASDLSAMQFNGEFFQNGAQTGIIFSLDTNVGKAQADRIRSELQANYVGEGNFHKPILLEGGVTVSSPMSDQEDMQFMEGRRINRTEILGVLGVDPTKVGIHEDANRSIARETGDSFHTETIASLETIIEEEIEHKLIIKIFGIDDTVLALNENDPRSQANKMSIWKEGLGSGVYTINEVRGFLGRPPVPGGDKPYVMSPTGMFPPDRLDEFADIQMEAIRSKSNANAKTMTLPSLGENISGDLND